MTLHLYFARRFLMSFLSVFTAFFLMMSLFDMLGDDDPYKRAVADGVVERINADWCAPSWSGRTMLAAARARLEIEAAARDRLSDGTMDRLRAAKRRARALVR